MAFFHYGDADEAIVQDTESSTEEELVDNVLNAMLKLSERIDDLVENNEAECVSEEESDETTTEEDVFLNDVYSEDDVVPIDNLCETAENFETDLSDEIIYREELSWDELPDDDNDEPDDKDESLLYSEEFAEEDDLAGHDTEEVLFEVDQSVEDNIVCDLPCLKILDAERYTFDELQSDLESMTFFKPQKDLKLHRIEDTGEITSNYDQVADETENDTILAKDVSLLMKFGYGSDAGLGISEEDVRDVIVEKNKQFSIEKHRIIHGFTGKTFEFASQKQSVEKKFKRDKTQLLIFAVIASIFAITMCIGDFISVQIKDVEDYITMMIIGIAFIVAISLMLLKRLYSGIISTIKSEYDPYSWICFLHTGYILYSLGVIVIFLNNPYYIFYGRHISLGGYVLLCTALTVWSEFFDCCRESDTFDTVSSDGEHYVAEKDVGLCQSLDKKKSDITNRYSVRRTHFVSGFFNRISKRQAKRMNSIIFMSVILAVSVVIGIAVSIITENVLDGVNSSLLIFLAAIPLSSAIVPSLIEYLNCLRLKKSGSAFIGSSVVSEYTEMDSLSLSGTEAVEIVSITEINPEKGSENTKKWSNMAKNVFISLGGPVSVFLNSQTDRESNIEHDLIINSVSENGIDVYFDSSVNVLLGDRQYMLAHNIKVKTDVKLATALKGSDRSVIYAAFDGVPRVGFIITSKIKPSFPETLKKLQSNEIKATVNTYEPEINENYFEANDVGVSLSVRKPVLYENIAVSGASDSGVVASSLLELCSLIGYGRVILGDRAQHKRTLLTQIIAGSCVSVLLVLLMCSSSETGLIEILRSNVLSIFYIASLLSLIPNVVHIVKILKRK